METNKKALNVRDIVYDTKRKGFYRITKRYGYADKSYYEAYNLRTDKDLVYYVCYKELELVNPDTPENRLLIQIKYA